MLLNSLIEISLANRLNELERLTKGQSISGDFEGSVTGYWVKLGSRGEGIVSYNNKNYVTKPIGFISIPRGTEIELSFANGIYYSKF
jgi:hypothetical protein